MAEILIKAAEKPDLLSEGLLQKFGQGLTLGWRDEASAQLSSLLTELLDPNAGKYETRNQVYERELARQRAQESAYEEAHPIASFASEMAGGALLGGGTAGLAAKLGLSGMGAAGALGLTEGGIYGAGAANEGDRLQQAALGSLFGGVMGPLGYLGGNMASRIMNRVTTATDRMRTVKAGEALGQTFTPAQRSGRGDLRLREAGFMGEPSTVQPFARQIQGNQQNSNRLTARLLGENADNLGEDTIDRIATRLEDEFGNLGGLKGIGFDDSSLNKLAALEADYQSFWGRKQKLPVLESAIDDILDLAGKGEKMPADRYQYLHSQLGKELKKARNDPAKLEVLGGLRDMLNDAVEQSLGPDQLARWQQARTDWRALQMLIKPGVIRDGNLSGPTLLNRLRQNNALDFARGADFSKAQDTPVGLLDIAKIDALSKDFLQSSGTTERALGAAMNRGLLRNPVPEIKGLIYRKYPGLFMETQATPAGLMGVTPAVSLAEMVKRALEE